MNGEWTDINNRGSRSREAQERPRVNLETTPRGISHIINELPTDVTSDSGVLTAEVVDRFLGEVFDERTQQPASQPPSPGPLSLQALREFAESMLPGPCQDLSREAIVREALINGTAIVRAGWNRQPGEPPHRESRGGLRSWIVDEVDPVYEDGTVPTSATQVTESRRVFQSSPTLDLISNRTERQRQRDARQAAEMEAARLRREMQQRREAMERWVDGVGHNPASNQRDMYNWVRGAVDQQFWSGSREFGGRHSRLTGPALYEAVMENEATLDKKALLKSSIETLKPYLSGIKALSKPKSRNRFSEEQTVHAITKLKSKSKKNRI